MLIEFYKKVLSNLGLTTDNEGFIYIVNSDGNQLLLNQGLPVVLPTKDHIGSMLQVKDDSFEQVKMLYNPIDENVVKGDNKSLIKTKSIIETRLGYAMLVLGKLLLVVASHTKMQEGMNLEVSKFLSSLSEVRKPNMKDIVDDKTQHAWTEILKKSITADRSTVSIFLKKSGVYNDVKYNRLATLKCNVYEDLLTATQDTPIYGVKLRNKDIATFKILFEYMLPDLDDNHVISLGSNDNISPAFISLMELYIKVMSRISNLIAYLKDIDQELADSGYVEISLTNDEIEGIYKFQADLKTIPTGTDIQKQLVQPTAPTVSVKPTVTQVVNQAVQQPLSPVPYNPGNEVSEEDKVLSFLRGQQQPTSPFGYNPMAMGPVQQPMMPMTNMFGQPVGQVGYGVSQFGYVQQPVMGIVM